MAFTLDSVGKQHTLYRDAQTGLYRAEITIHDQRYDTGSGLATVVEALEADGTEGFALRANRLRHAVRLANDGTRRWYPRRNVPTEYVEFGRPEYWTGAAWQPLVLGTPVQPDPGSLLWVKPAYALQLTLGWRRLKMDLRLKTSAAARRVRWPVSLTGLGWSDWSLLGQDGTTVGRIDRPTAEDANGVAVPLTVQYAGGYVSVLADLTGVTYPVVIDPTLISTLNTGGDDGWWRTNPSNAFVNNEAQLAVGNNAALGAWDLRNDFLRFASVTIPAGATIGTATLKRTGRYTESGKNVIARIAAAKAANPAAPTTVAECTGPTRTTATVAWNFAATVQNTQYTSSDIAAIIQELVNTYSYGSGAAMVLYHEDNGTNNDIANNRLYFYAAEATTESYRPILTIEYTAGNPYYAYAQQ